MHKTYLLPILMAVCCCQRSFAIDPGARVVVNRDGKLVTGEVVELISGDSNTVIKLLNGKTIVSLTNDIAYGLPPLLKESKTRDWRIDKGDNVTAARFVALKDDKIYLQKPDGIVISFQASSISETDLSFARERTRTLPKALLSAGDSIRIVISNSPPVDRKIVLEALSAAIERSGYIVSEDAGAQLSVEFRREDPQVKVMSGLSGDREIKFNATTARITLVANEEKLHAVSYTTKSPFTLPAGEEGEKKLRDAETMVLPFLRSLALSPRFEMGK